MIRLIGTLLLCVMVAGCAMVTPDKDGGIGGTGAPTEQIQ